MNDRIDIVEELIRRFIHAVLERGHGLSYWKTSIPADIQQKVRNRISDQRRKKSHLDSHAFDGATKRLQFCDVADYSKILRANNNWGFFKEYIPRRPHLEAYLDFFSEFRNSIKHNRDIDPLSESQGIHAVEWLQTNLEVWLLRVGQVTPGPRLEIDVAGSTSKLPQKRLEDTRKVDVSLPEKELSDQSRAEPTALLEVHYAKVLTRLSVFYPIKEIQDVLSIAPEDFRSKKGVGVTYVASLRELQKALLSASEAGAKALDDTQPTIPDSFSLNWSRLRPDERSALAKIEKTLGREALASDVLKLDLANFESKTGIGRSTVQRITTLQQRIAHDYEGEKSSVGIHNFELLVNREPRDLSPIEVETLLVDDIAEFAKAADQRERTVFLARWGYDRPTETLEGIGGSFGITRERVRQLEARAFQQFRRSLRVPPGVLWENLRDDLQLDLQTHLPQLRARFDSERGFFEFLEFVTGQPPGRIAEHQLRPKLSLSSLEDFFRSVESPTSVRSVIDFLNENFSLNGVQARHFLTDLTLKGRLLARPDGLIPQGMKKEAAIAHVLLKFPDGLHWKEIAREVNERGLCRQPLSKDRSDGTLSSSPNLVLVGRGRYTHRTHLTVTEEQVQSTLRQTRNYLSANKRDAVNLQEVYSQLDTGLSYFETRFFCQEFGEAFGIHGVWTSSTDTISLGEKPARVPTGEFVYQWIEGSGQPVGTAEIQGLLRTPSEGWVKVLLYRLVQDGRIVELTPGQYLTSQRAQALVEQLGVPALARRLRDKYGELDIADMRALINEQLQERYTKEFLLRATEVD